MHKHSPFLLVALALLAVCLGVLVGIPIETGRCLWNGTCFGRGGFKDLFEILVESSIAAVHCVASFGRLFEQGRRVRARLAVGGCMGGSGRLAGFPAGLSAEGVNESESESESEGELVSMKSDGGIYGNLEERRW